MGGCRAVQGRPGMAQAGEGAGVQQCVCKKLQKEATPLPQARQYLPPVSHSRHRQGQGVRASPQAVPFDLFQQVPSPSPPPHHLGLAHNSQPRPPSFVGP